MNISFDENTKLALEKHLNDKKKKAIRLHIKGFGWGGPTLGLVLDEQKDDDISENIEGLTFVAQKDEAYIFDSTKILFSKSIFGDSFKVLSNRSSHSSCR